jgi:hypothetical protein
MLVEVTEFIPPRGRQEQQHLEVADDCAVGYESLRRHHCRLTAERLTTGSISTCIEHEEGDYDIQIVPHELGKFKEAVEGMLRRFDGAKFEEWLKAVTASEVE